MAFEGYCTADEVRATFGKDEDGDYLLTTSIISDVDVQTQITRAMSVLDTFGRKSWNTSASRDTLFPNPITTEYRLQPIKFICIQMTRARVMMIVYGSESQEYTTLQTDAEYLLALEMIEDMKQGKLSINFTSADYMTALTYGERIGYTGQNYGGYYSDYSATTFDENGFLNDYDEELS